MTNAKNEWINFSPLNEKVLYYSFEKSKRTIPPPYSSKCGSKINRGP